MRGCKLILNNTEVHTGNDLDLVQEVKKISNPEVQTFSVQVPGRNGLLNLTKGLTGKVTYLNRAIVLEYFASGTRAELLALIDRINTYHGETVRVVDDDTPNHFYEGELTVAYELKPNYVRFKLEVDAQPFRYSINEIVQSFTLNGQRITNVTPYPYYYSNGYVNNGITYKVNVDGSISCTGTASATSIFYVTDYDREKINLVGAYTLSGCPSGGSNSTYKLDVLDGNSSSVALMTDHGSGNTVTLNANKWNMRIVIYSGQTVNNLVFKPMLESGSVKHKYIKSGTTSVVGEPREVIIINNGVDTVPTVVFNDEIIVTKGSNIISLRSPNLVPYPYYNASGYTNNGITFTINKDGSVTLNGTATAEAYYRIASNTPISNMGLKVGETYVVSGITGGTTSTYMLNLYVSDGSVNVVSIALTNGEKVFSLPQNSTSCSMGIRVKSGQTVNNITFRPLLKARKSVPLTDLELDKGTNTFSVEGIGSLDIKYREAVI